MKALFSLLLVLSLHPIAITTPIGQQIISVQCIECGQYFVIDSGLVCFDCRG